MQNSNNYTGRKMVTTIPEGKWYQQYRMEKGNHYTGRKMVTTIPDRKWKPQYRKENGTTIPEGKW